MQFYEWHSIPMWVWFLVLILLFVAYPLDCLLQRSHETLLQFTCPFFPHSITINDIYLRSESNNMKPYFILYESYTWTIFTDEYQNKLSAFGIFWIVLTIHMHRFGYKFGTNYQNWNERGNDKSMIYLKPGRRNWFQ